MVGVTENENENRHIRAMPNPTTGNFTLQFNVQSVSGELEIFDVMGNMVWREYIAPWSQYKRIDISKLANGIYLCKILRGDNVETLKIIKE
ncbi:MAG: T9SS type A sorting domain-containing protein [Bacteroidia bacterium]|nr:T9SS type A sorting domain-containing protein [Bacteroidia bacterium]